jgi:uncharacterized membrane protein
MPDLEPLLTRWQSAGVLDSDTAQRIRAYELKQKQPSGLRWQGLVALILGAMLLGCGVVLFVSAHWDQMGPGSRFGTVIAMVALFHIAAAWSRASYHGLSAALHAVGTISIGAAIALTGQIFNIQEHWPAAVLMWAIAAAAGWVLLGDEAQQTITLLLFPAWLFCEFSFHAESHIGADVYLARALIVWAILYLTVFLGSKHKVAQGILFAIAAVAAIVGTVIILIRGWNSWSPSQTFLPLSLRAWAWAGIAALPLAISLRRPTKALVPVAVAIAFTIALPWCMTLHIQHYDYADYRTSYTYSTPNLIAHALVAVFAIFVAWWGVRESSKALVNLGMVWFAVTVAWFYFSDIMDKFGRSLGLIGLGILFLAGGWGLEKMRRSLMARMVAQDSAKETL